jgi:regulator of sirC expression with transglutaminase-like and TPR domain
VAKEKINKKEIKALVSLLDDDDKEVLINVEQKLLSLGGDVIPLLESEWEYNFNPTVQRKIEDIIHVLQFENLLDRFHRWKNQKGKDLLTGMWLVATYQYPDLELENLTKELEQIYYEVWTEFKPDLYPYDQVKVLNGVLFSKLRFSANTKNFHSPSNSMINSVLETRKGNPISLAVVYLLIARKLNMPVYGVNLPNLFILTFKNKETQFYINAFNRGLIFSREDIDNYISELHLNKQDTFYEPCTNLDIIQRVLRNLMVSFEKIGDHYKVDEVKRLLNSIL